MATPGKSARNKGLNFERKLAVEFRELGWPKAKRHLESQAVEAEKGIDLEHTEPFLVQCKAHAKYAPLTAIQQVKPQEGGIPLLITKGDRQRPIVAMYWDDFKKLIKK